MVCCYPPSSEENVMKARLEKIEMPAMGFHADGISSFEKGYMGTPCSIIVPTFSGYLDPCMGEGLQQHLDCSDWSFQVCPNTGFDGKYTVKKLVVVSRI